MKGILYAVTRTKIDGEVLNELQHFISQCNEDSGLSIQLCLNEPKHLLA